jgi:hypothetical protein
MIITQHIDLRCPFQTWQMFPGLPTSALMSHRRQQDGRIPLSFAELHTQLQDRELSIAYVHLGAHLAPYHEVCAPLRYGPTLGAAPEIPRRNDIKQTDPDWACTSAHGPEVSISHIAPTFLTSVWQNGQEHRSDATARRLPQLLHLISPSTHSR